MPLQTPTIDNRTYQDIVKEARARIPRYTTEWTDLNDNDPGIALVQLFLKAIQNCRRAAIEIVGPAVLDRTAAYRRH